MSMIPSSPSHALLATALFYCCCSYACVTALATEKDAKVVSGSRDVCVRHIAPACETQPAEDICSIPTNGRVGFLCGALTTESSIKAGKDECHCTNATVPGGMQAAASGVICAGLQGTNSPLRLRRLLTRCRRKGRRAAAARFLAWVCAWGRRKEKIVMSCVLDCHVQGTSTEAWAAKVNLM